MQYNSVEKAIDDFISSGCDPAKIVAGLPAYGRHAQNPGLVKTYSEIIDGVIQNESNTKIDKKQLLSINEHGGYLFDSPRMIQAKVEMVRKKGLKGVFFWELGQDFRNDEISPAGLLLQSASKHKDNDEL